MRFYWEFSRENCTISIFDRLNPSNHSRSRPIATVMDNDVKLANTIVDQLNQNVVERQRKEKQRKDLINLHKNRT